VNPPAPRPPPEHPRHRRRSIALVGAALAIVIAAGYYLQSRRFEKTDDAQIDGDISNVGARVTGTVIAVHVVEHQWVRPGDLLVEVDPAELRVAVARARAAVAQAEAELRAEDPNVPITRAENVAALVGASSELSSAEAAVSAARSQVGQLEAQVAEARASERFARDDAGRARQLLAARALPRAEYDRRASVAEETAARSRGLLKSLAAARERVAQERAHLASTRSRLSQVRQTAPHELESRRATVTVRQANLEAARAQLAQAELELGYAAVRAPTAGIVARKGISVGDHVSPGQALVAIVQTDRLWVTANFRETQLRRLGAGQRARVHVDALDVDLDGAVDSLGGATGARLSVLPPENATGNYVKVVQRIPVRIRLEPGQGGLDRLRPGMSVEPRVRVVP
jgi:membrane fusion protein (multidrug efflux system)